MESSLEARVEKYIELEKRALDQVAIAVPENSVLYIYARDSLMMIKAYFEDAQYFRQKGDLINALSALNYSYGWIDSGVRLGIFKTDNDYAKFTFFR
ncbi:MAG: DUF357 domain-containing protein [Candidatus Thermoplasmatota archaeon]|nr:DUF357 domain-containing protein [Candidatus Thermoplasmatota archaeon]MCL5791297.1 DUF357 domain-containing protein [Candidatus Thermoplasmatota archaeon]